MVLARWQRSIVDGNGNVIGSPNVEVRRQIVGMPLASLYSDRAGADSIGNPFIGEVDGSVAFHVIGGPYWIRVYKDGFERIWEWVGIGTASETDAGESAESLRITTITAAGAVTVAADDEIILLNKTVGAATSVNFPDAASYIGRGISIKDIKGDAQTNNITPVFNGGQLCDGLAGTDFVINWNYGDQGVFRPLPSGAGWYLHRR